MIKLTVNLSLNNCIDPIWDVWQSTSFSFYLSHATRPAVPKDKFEESIFLKTWNSLLHFYSSRQSTNHFVVRFKVEQPRKLFFRCWSLRNKNVNHSWQIEGQVNQHLFFLGLRFSNWIRGSLPSQTRSLIRVLSPTP